MDRFALESFKSLQDPCGFHTGMFGAWFEALKPLLDARNKGADTPSAMALAKSLSVYGTSFF